jgi:3-oxoacyl-[acyl-carrier protein] reductase
MTGSTRGIGRSIAEACSRAGASVVVSSRTEDAVGDTVNDFAAQDLRACGMSADVSSAEDIECLFETTVGLLGRIDAWVNNAGISLGYRPLDEISAEELRRLVDVNLTATMLACRLLVPYFAENGGVLLNMAGRGYRGGATPFTAAYAATKSAVASLTRSVAAENRGRPVSVHAVMPGMVETDFYRDITVSPRLEHVRDNWRYALDAFGVPLDEVGARTADIIAQEPGRDTGRVYSFVGGSRMVRGMAKIAWYRATGKLPREV